MKPIKQNRSKTLVIFYSYTGTAKQLATETANKRGAALCEIKDLKRPNAVLTYTKGAFMAMRHKSAKIEMIGADFSYYDKLVIFAPIWAGNPAPPINTVLHSLPKGKDVEIHLVSGGGQSKCKEYISDLLKQKGCRLVKYRNIKKPSSTNA